VATDDFHCTHGLRAPGDDVTNSVAADGVTSIERWIFACFATEIRYRNLRTITVAKTPQLT